jgi:glucose-1-phosphate thymidylyltransferase
MSAEHPIAFVDACVQRVPGDRGLRRSHYLTQIANRPLISHVIDGLIRAGAERVVIRTDQRTRSALTASLGSEQRVSFLDAEDEEAVEHLLAIAGERPILACPGDCLAGEELIALCDLVRSGEHDAVWLTAADARRPDNLERLAEARALRERSEPLAVIALAEAWRHLPSDRGRFVLSALGGAFEDAGLRVRRLRSRHAWRYSDAPEQLLLANLMLLDALPATGPCMELPDGSLAHGRVAVDQSARISGSRLRGPLLIGANARIEDSFIGPYTTVGPNAIVIGAEIEYAMVMDGAEVRYPGQRLEESVIGEGAIISRSFALPSGAHLRVDAGAKVILS